MKIYPTSLLIVILGGICGAAVAKPLTIKGRVIDDARCADLSAPDCAGLTAIVVVTKVEGESGEPSATCSYNKDFVVGEGASESDGSFKIAVSKTKLGATKMIQVNVCLLSYVPSPDQSPPRKTKDQSSIVVRLSPVVKTMAEAKRFASTIRARTGQQPSQSRQRLGGEWERLEKVGYPPEARALLGRALLQEAPTDAASVPAIRTYGKVDLGELDRFRGHVAAGLRDRSGALSVEGANSAKTLPAEVTQDVLINEARKPGQQDAVIKLMQSLPPDRRFRRERLENGPYK